MDHFALPKDASRCPPRIPYVCSTPYDGGDFLTYPLRAGEQWHRALPARDQPAFWMVERKAPSDDRQLESFLQTWIFFGLLHETLAVHDLFDAADYIETDEQGSSWIHTRCLAATLRTWRDKTRSMDKAWKEALKTRLCECLSLADLSLRCLTSDSDNPSIGHPGFSRPVKASIVAICETVSSLGDMTLNVLPDQDWLLFNVHATFDDDDRALMAANGWCPSLIESETADFDSAAFGWYLKHLRLPWLGIEHSRCSKTECHTVQIDEATYTPRHVEEQCACPALGPTLSEVAQCLDRGTFPVLEIVLGDIYEPVTAKVVPYEEGIAYVALSHVWVDGLGNPAELTLPSCQLRRLWSLVQNLQGRTFRWLEGEGEMRIEERKLHLWCDSLLCPIQIWPGQQDGMTEEELMHFNEREDVKRSKQLKTLALAQMRNVYSKAAYVLVLDRGLESFNSEDIGLLESTIRLLTCRWMQRLWTYQEAALPAKLLIQFSDKALDFREVALHMKACYSNEPVLRSLCQIILARCVGLRSLIYLRHSGGPDLMNFYSSVRKRRVKYAEDEPLCAATVLDLNLQQIAEVDGQVGRMAMLWRLMSDSHRGIPDNIVFNQFPRLPLPGYTWAPSSLRQDPSQPFRRLVNPQSSNRATLAELGLRVSFPGCRIKAGNAPMAASGPGWENLHGPAGLLHIKDEDGRWFKMSIPPKDSPGGQEESAWHLLHRARGIDWHVILDGDQLFGGGTDYQNGILGYLQRHDDGEQVFHSRTHVVLRLLEPQWATVMKAAEKHAAELQTHSTFRWYQLCFSLDVLAGSIISRLPPILRKPLASLCRIAISRWSRTSLVWVVTELQNRGKIDWQSKETAAAMTSLSTPGTNDFHLGGHIGINFVGCVATITEHFGPSREWCVA